jgi:hypothetical protein
LKTQRRFKFESQLSFLWSIFSIIYSINRYTLYVTNKQYKIVWN